MTNATRVQTKKRSGRHRIGCLVADCAKPHFGNGYCQTHNYRFKTNGDPLVTRKPGSPPGESNPSWRGDDVEYQAVHRRLRVYRGPASAHPCAACQSRARDWAYMHSDPGEKISAKVGLPFSTDLSHYRPLCSSCHNTLDARHGWTHPDYFGRGTSKANGRWRAYYTKAGRQVSLGRYDTRDEAAAVAHRARLALLDELVP